MTYLCAQMKKNLAIMGATGSIGTQTLEVVRQHPEHFNVEVLTAHSNIELLAQQAEEFNPNVVVIADESKLPALKQKLAHLSTKVYDGVQAMNDVVQWESVDVVVAAIVGSAGLSSTLAAVEAGKTIALANKETLVMAGDIVMKKTTEHNSSIIPLDSEHSAIYQCLVGENPSSVDRIILTASGGPFLGKKPNFLVNVKKSHALEHPNWVMGAKISVDSASLMNKGLEMIEAKHLFGLRNEQIEVIIHPQSIIHSMVEFCDGSIKAQLGMPDMRVPIQYALGLPNRLPNNFKKFSFKDYESFTFEEPDVRTFRNLQLAKDAMFKGGNMPTILNAANEIAVDAFLNNKVGFLDMSEIIESVMNEIEFIEQPSLEEILESDNAAKKAAAARVKEFA